MAMHDMTKRALWLSRRSFLASGSAMSTLSFLPGTPKAQGADPTSLADYTPTYLAESEWAFVMAAVARLIPSEGDGPGALEARVPVFIDRQLAGAFGQAASLYMEGPFVPDADPEFGYQSPLTPAEIYRQAIPAFDSWCTETYGASFVDLDASRQDAALTALEKGEAKLAPSLRDFFALLLQNTREGYFADPMYGGNHEMAGWVHIGFPGARASFLEWTDPALDDVAYPLGPVSISGQRA